MVPQSRLEQGQKISSALSARLLSRSSTDLRTSSGKTLQWAAMHVRDGSLVHLLHHLPLLRLVVTLHSMSCRDDLLERCSLISTQHRLLQDQLRDSMKSFLVHPKVGCAVSIAFLLTGFV